jgi:hypothetical protein
MAINIQEILHPSDSDAIKFEKINYNFDQIVANGGGPTGQKGNQGIQGAKGNVGAKGQKGDLGAKGETGATTSRWEVITVNPDSTGTYSILKPKLLTDDIHPHVWLGDQLFNENTGSDGQTNIRATITIGKNAQGTVGYDSDEYIRFWHGADLLSNKVSIDMQSTNISADNSVRYEFGKSFDADPGAVVEFKASFDKFTIAPTSTFKVPAVGGTDAAAQQPEIGLIRYNTDTNVFEGGLFDGAQTTWTSFCMAPCGQGTANYSISISPEGDISVNETGTPTGNSVSFTPADNVEIDAFGETWVEPTSSTTTTSTTTTSTTTNPIQEYTISFSGNGLNNGQWEINGLDLVSGSAGSNWAYDSQTLQGTIDAGPGDTITLNLHAIPATGRQFVGEEPFGNVSGAIMGQQYSDSSDAGVQLGITLPTSGSSHSVTIEAATTASTYTATWSITEQIVNGAAYESLDSNTTISQISASAASGNSAQATVWVGADDAAYMLVAQDMTGYDTTLGTSTIGSDTTNSNGENRVPITVSYTMGVGNASGTLTLQGSSTQMEYTVSVWEQASHSGICNATTSNYTWNYPANLDNSAGAFRSYFANNYTLNSGTIRSIKIISSTEPAFLSAGWTVRMDDDNNVDIGWAECSSYTGTTFSFVNNTGQPLYFTYYDPATCAATTDSPLGAGLTRTKCHCNNAAGAPYWSNSSGDPITITSNASITHTGEACI